MEQIANSSEEQNIGIEQITKNMDNTNNVTQQNSTAAIEMTTAAQTMRQSADDLKNVITQFKKELDALASAAKSDTI